MRDLIVRCKHDPALCSALGQRIKAHTQRKLGRPLDQLHVVTAFGRNRELTGSRDQVLVLKGLLGQPDMEIRTIRRNGSNRSGIGSDCVCQDRQRK